MNYKISRKKPNLELYFNLPNPPLLSFLRNNELGNIVDIRTPLFNKEKRSIIIDRWMEQIQQNRHLLLDEQYDLEFDESKKIGRYSAMFPFKDRMDSVELNYKFNSNSKINENLIRRGISEVFKNKHKNSIRLVKPENLIHEIPLNTNSGAPKFQRRSSVINYSLNLINDYYFQSDYKLFKEFLKHQICILGWRGQPIDKQRVVWMFPMVINLLEAMYYKPLIRQYHAYSNKPEFIDSLAIEDRITNLFNSKSNKDLVIATDFDKFDAHFNETLQDISYELKCYQTNPRYIDDKFRDLHYLKFNIPLVCTKDIAYFGKHGMATGSGGTNMDENESHEVMQYCCAINDSSTLNQYSTRLGDDGILTYPGISLDAVKETYENYFDQSINVSKQHVSTESTKYLQKLYHVGYRDSKGTILGVYSTMRALGRLLGQEKYQNPEEWSKEMVILRSLSIIENCNRNPLFEKFIDFVISGDKYELGMKIPGFFDRLKRIKLKDLYNDMSHSVSYSKYLEFENNPNSGISSWKVIRYLINKLKSKA